MSRKTLPTKVTTLKNELFPCNKKKKQHSLKAQSWKSKVSERIQEWFAKFVARTYEEFFFPLVDSIHQNVKQLETENI